MKLFPVPYSLLPSLALCASAYAGMMSIPVGTDMAKIDEPARAVAVQAISTNASGTATIKVVTPLVVEWYEPMAVTNVTYRPATSNVQYTATETLWSAYATNAYSVATGSVVRVSIVTNVANVVTGAVWSASTGLSNLTHTVTNVVALTNAVPLVRTGVTSNLLARAWGAKPYVANWNTNDLLYVSQSIARTLSSNVTYQVVDTRSVTRESVRRTVEKQVTNTLWTATLSSGYKTNSLSALLFPGDMLFGTGTAFQGGRVQLLIER